MQAHTRLGVFGAGTKLKVLHRLREHPDPSLPSEVLSDMHLLPDHETEDNLAPTARPCL